MRKLFSKEDVGKVREGYPGIYGNCPLLHPSIDQSYPDKDSNGPGNHTRLKGPGFGSVHLIKSPGIEARRHRVWLESILYTKAVKDHCKRVNRWKRQRNSGPIHRMMSRGKVIRHRTSYVWDYMFEICGRGELNHEPGKPVSKRFERRAYDEASKRLGRRVFNDPAYI